MSLQFQFLSGKARDFALPVCFFVFFLLYFVFGAGWYEPAKLVLHGQAVTGSTQLQVRWDSGKGFNDYEQRLFKPQIQPRDGHVSIAFGATGRRNPASQSKNVVCTAILIDEKEIDLGSLADKKMAKDRMLHFKDVEKITFTVPAKWHVSIRFRTDTNSGIAFVSVNGMELEHDLYMANEAAKFKQIDYWLLQPDGSFKVETNLPRYSVHELEILSGDADRPVRLLAAELHGKNQVLDLLNGHTVELGSFRYKNPLNRMRSFFHPVQFVQQIIFALLSAWLLTVLIRFVRARDGLSNCFLAEKRLWFWLMLAISLAVFGTWLAAFWPAVMSIDSLKVWRAALLPNVYLNDHPFLNVIFYSYLRHFWNNQSVVAVTQIILTSLLLSWFGFWIYRQGVPLRFTLLWLCFVLCSVPVSVYNLMLWKDVPFALLAVFWACLLVKLRQEKQQHLLRWSSQQICAFFLLGLALGLIRHNGLLYLGVLPGLLLLLGLMPLKKTLLGLAGLLLLAGVGFAVLHVTGGAAGTGFLTQELRKYTTRLSAQNIAKDSVRTMQDYLTVLNINQQHQQWDKFHYYFYDRQAWWFLLHSGWWDIYPYQKEMVHFHALNKAALQIYEKSYHEPWVWLSWNPVWLLALLPLLTLLFWWLPNTAVLGAVLLSGALPLIYLRIFNWRYYYFLYFGLLFVPAFISLDFSCRKKCVSPS